MMDFGNHSEEIDRSLERKLELMGLDESFKIKLSEMPCDNICKKKKKHMGGMKISIEDIQGFNRAEMCEKINWLECLGELHHMKTFELCKNKEFFNKILTDIGWVNQLGAPEVILHNDKYYIGSDGKHRLTMAKCMGMPEALVSVYTI